MFVEVGQVRFNGAYRTGAMLRLGDVRPLLAALLGLCAAMLLGVAGGCSPGDYKELADKEVNEIIDSKWQDSFGYKANYTISDVEASPNDLQVAKAVPSSGVLSLAQAVAIATAHNRDYQSRKEQLYLSALDLTGDRYKFARRWFGTVDADYTKEDDEESVSSGAEGGFSQLLADGAVISTSIAIDWARFLTGDPDRSLGSVLSATITQPLLRGRGRKIAQEGLTQSERNVLYEMRGFSRFRKEFVVSIVSDYYSVLQSRNAVTNAENNYQRVTQAEQDVLKARDSLVRAQEGYEQALDEFKIELSFDTDTVVELDQNELKALEEIGITEPEYTLEAAIETGLLERLDLATSVDKTDDAARKVMIAADNLGAELNLTAGAEIGSTGDTEFERLQFHKGAYGIGLSADLPFDRKDERNAYRGTLIKLQQSRRGHEESVSKVKLGIRQGYRQLIETQERYRIQKNSLELARKRVESTAMLLKMGRVQTRDLLDSQNDLLDAENELTDALVGHTIAKLNFFRDIGVLQVRPDGMWKQYAGTNQDKNYERK